MSNKRANFTRKELIDRINYCERVLEKTKSYKCYNDHLKALKRYKKELKFYDKCHEEGNEMIN